MGLYFKFLSNDSLAYGSLNETKIINISNKTSNTFNVGSKVNTLIFLKNGLLACGSSNGTTILDIENENVINRFDLNNSINSLVELPDGSLISDGFDKTIKIWNITTGSIIYTLNDDSTQIEVLVINVIWFLLKKVFLWLVLL